MEWTQIAMLEGGAIKVPGRWLYLHYYEAMNLLFRLENALRVFVYVVLKTEHGSKWADVSIGSDEGETTIAAIAKRRRSQAGTFGYLGYPVSSPLLFLNTGELTRVITSETYWKLFAKYFTAAKNVVSIKFEELNSVRNALAHFRPIRSDDLDTVKQSSKHVLSGVAEVLNQLIKCPDTVPTNSNMSWYTDLATLGSKHCALKYSQSTDEAWHRIDLHYSMPVFEQDEMFSGFFMFGVPNLRVPAVLSEFPGLRDTIVYATEEVDFVHVKREEGRQGEFGKTLSFGLSKKALESNADLVKSELEELLGLIESETDLVEKDSLARGRILRPVTTYLQIPDGAGSGFVDRRTLHSESRADDPVEWWGRIYRHTSDFVSGSQTFPWIPTEVSSTAF